MGSSTTRSLGKVCEAFFDSQPRVCWRRASPMAAGTRKPPTQPRTFWPGFTKPLPKLGSQGPASPKS